MSGYSTREVAQLVGLTAEQIRRWVRQGLLSPSRGTRGELRFHFQDIVLLRTAKGLQDARVPARRAAQALRRLRSDLGSAASLAALRITAEGAHVVVHEDDALWDVQSGQGQLCFSTRQLAGEVAELRGRRLESAGVFDSDDYYNLGIDLEEVDPPRAEQAYRRALELDPNNVDAHVNLGRLLQTQGRTVEAREQYRLTLERAPDHQLALYNLGTSFDEADELDAAVDCYRKADRVADAHYNLCRIFEIRGDEIAALRHFRRYRQLSGEDDR